MKKVFYTILVSIFAISLFAMGGNNHNSSGSNIWNDIYSYIDSLPKEKISDIEKTGLIQMREEEKLARDVYITLYEKWDLRIFKNISNSENTHTLAVKHLLEKYNIEDPVKNDSIGVFESEEMQKLYNDLVKQGNKSLLDALMVGATVEDLDIFDLQKLIEETDNKDIKMVYQNLMKGSRNHMRSFNMQIKRENGEYKAQFLSQDKIDSILNGSHEKGVYDFNGKAL